MSQNCVDLQADEGSAGAARVGDTIVASTYIFDSKAIDQKASPIAATIVILRRNTGDKVASTQSPATQLSYTVPDEKHEGGFTACVYKPYPALQWVLEFTGTKRG